MLTVVSRCDNRYRVFRLGHPRMARQLTGYRIRERRRQLGLTQAGVAKQVGISPSYLNLIEANKRSIAGAVLNRITELLDLDAETLTGRT